jgi:poly(A) polymerase
LLFKEILNTIATLAAEKNKKIYLVGGFIRDLYLGNSGRDLDFAVSGNAMSLAQSVADALKGVYVPLDRINRVARVVLEPHGEKWQIDFSSFKGLNIEDDLSNRDFTINATALELSDYIKLSDESGALTGQRAERWRWHEKIMDPYSGLADIENKTIRAINNYVFEADPVRILRGVRLAGKLDFSIKQETQSLMEKNRWLLQEVSGERAWEELSAILALPQSYHWIKILDNIGALSDLIPVEEIMKVTDQKRHKENVWTHSLKTYDLLEKICGDPSRELGATGRSEDLRELILQHLGQPLTAGRRRIQLIKIAALLHDPGKAVTAKLLADGQVDFPEHSHAGLAYVSEFARRFKISKTEEAYLKNIVGSHMYPLSLYINKPASPGAIHRFFSRLGKETADTLLLSLANVAAGGTAGENALDLLGYRVFVGDLLYKYYFEAGTYVQPPTLVKGEDLIAVLGLPPSKKIGELLEKISEAQVNGEVANREEAIAYAAGLLDEDKTGE